MRRLVAFVAAAAALAVALLAPPAAAQEPSASFETATGNGFPTTLTFSLTAEAQGEIVDVSLRYSITGRGTRAIGKPDELVAGPAVTTEVTIPTSGTGGYIPVGSEFVYFWELTLADGSTVVSDSDTFFYLPPGEDWQRAESEFIHVYYYGDRASLAQEYLAAAAGTYERIGELLQTELEIVPVNVVLFPTEEELEAAQPQRSETYDDATGLCGTQVTENIVLVREALCGTRDRSDTLRHEFTHILTKAAGESALGRIPTWLDEGTAVYSQSEPGSGYTDSFDAAVRLDQLIPFGEMVTGNDDPRTVGVFYGQSYEMVVFLLDLGGEDRFAELYATIKEGNRFDVALELVYGFDFAGFEDAFRQQYGLAPASEEPAPTATPVPRREDDPTPVPTAAPQASSGTSDDDGGSISGLTYGIIGGAVLLALLGVLSYLASMMFANRREPAAATSTRPVSPPAAQEAERDEWGPR